jgi:ATP-dependent RNA helicase RhlE
LTFDELGLIGPLRRAVADVNYERPTPIQIKAIPPLLAGRDLLGCAQTGTGKTAAFALPVLQRLHERRRAQRDQGIGALVLTPTRELAAQILESFEAYGRFTMLRAQVIFGGVPETPQIRDLRRGSDILVATPGRLLDLMGRGHVDLSHVECFVLDEADRMLDMGFIHDVRRVMQALPRQRQNLLFSATMPSTIVQLADSFLHDPVRVEASPTATPVALIDQQVMFVERGDKPHVLANLLGRPEVERALVFTRTKHGANRLAQQLERFGIGAAALHGNKSQGARSRALAGFRDGALSVLVATDLASRGLDVDDISHVFNYDLTNEPEVYVHRIGRTARAGRGGVAISFCDQSERAFLRDIERLLGRKVPVAALDAASRAPRAETVVAKPSAEPAPAPSQYRRSRSAPSGRGAGSSSSSRGAGPAPRRWAR